MPPNKLYSSNNNQFLGFKEIFLMKTSRTFPKIFFIFGIDPYLCVYYAIDVMCIDFA